MGVDNGLARTTAETVADDGRHQLVQSYWHGRALGPYEQLSLKSFIDHGHTVHLYSFDPDLAVPHGVLLMDAASVLPETDFFTYSAPGFGHGSPAAFSNWFRYALLSERGGWWVDTDVVCLSDALPIQDCYFARESADVIANGTIRFPLQHPVMVECLRRARTLGRDVVWGQVGPRLLTQVLVDQGLSEHASPASECYPIYFADALDLVRPDHVQDARRRVANATFLHLWQSTLGHHGVDVYLLPPPKSLVGELCETHGIVDGWHSYDERRLESDLAARAAQRQQSALIESLTAELGAQAQSIDRYAEQTATLEAQADRLTAELRTVYSSTSWRLTAPMRRVVDFTRYGRRA
jgi:hypothetical protein